MFCNNQVMLFWRKNKAKEIRDDLESIRRKIKSLEKFEHKVEKTKSILNKIKGYIDDAKKDIKERAKEEKAKPSIDANYDHQIDVLADQEIKMLDKLDSDVNTYLNEVEEIRTEEDLDAALDLIEEEEDKINKRERENEQKIEKMETDTLKSRLATPSDAASVLATRDGDPYSKIIYVVRQLGGWYKAKEGTHEGNILFPRQTRPIPISSDVGTRKLVGQIIDQLNHLPEHKKPDHRLLFNALKKGDLFRVL